MKVIIRDFIGFFINAILIISLMFASFLLVVNLFHYKEMNYSYVVTNDNRELKKFNISVDEALNKMNKFDISSVSNDMKMAAVEIAEGLRTCGDELSAISFYDKDSLIVDYNFVYEINNTIKNNLSNKCLFTTTYYMSNVFDKYGLDKEKFNVISNNFNSDKVEVDYISNYIDSKLLANTNYSYTSDTVRETIYNDLSSDYNLIIKNYNIVANNFLELINFYVSYFGG